MIGAAAVFAVHANGSTMQNTDNGGLILIQAYNGSVVATGNAVQADALTAGSSAGGEIRIEAKSNVTLDTAAIFARGDFNASGGFGSGGMIGPLAPTVPPPGQAPIRAFLGALSWQNGVGDVRPTGAGVAAGKRGEINLQACTGVNTASSTFPVLVGIVGTYPNVLGAACAGAPIVPAYVTGFPAATCESLCTAPRRRQEVRHQVQRCRGRMV